MAANNYVDRKWELAREYGFQNSYKYWDPYLDSLLEKSDDKLEWYDKAMLNVNPDLKAKRDAYQKSLSRSNQLQSDLNNIESARQFLQNNVSQQKERINKLYDLQDKAAAISASIQWTNRVAGWLWAASNVLNNGRWVTEATKHQQILQNDAQRESALANVAQQEANIPSVLASLDQANANAELARAQANYYNNQKSWWSSNSYYSRGWWGSKWNDEGGKEYKRLNWLTIDWQTIKWLFYQDSSWNYYDAWWNQIYDAKSKQRDPEMIKLLPDPEKKDNTSSSVGTWKKIWWTVIPSLRQNIWTWNNIIFKNIPR